VEERRRGKIASLAEVERLLGHVERVALGGMLLESKPAALVRALLRSGARDLFLTAAPAASWDADVLIGAGRVARLRIPHISLAGLGLAPLTRSALEAGHVTVEECDEALLLGGYLAANHNSSIQVLDHLGTNDVVEGNPLIVRSGHLTGVEALRVDVALLHAPVGDAAGNLVHFGSRWADLLIARAAQVVIAQVDTVVPSSEASRLGVSIPGHLVDRVVVTPFGAHPLGSVGHYVADLQHLVDYKAAVEAGGIDAYLAEYCDIDHESYVGLVPAGRRRELERAAT
jgi:glutaconate CoA-transferase subunit A